MTLQSNNLRLMTPEQASFVRRQWEAHQHEDFTVDFDISGFGDVVLQDFLVAKAVWNPFAASGGRHARWLSNNTRLFWEKKVLEIGSGTGLLGIVMALCGARHVIMSDISEKAVQNTRNNVKRYDLEAICDVRTSDLFEQVPEQVDMILWNIPFFPGYPPEQDTISASMIMSPDLLRRFLSDARDHLTSNGVVVVPSFSFGGELTDPLLVSYYLGYTGERTWIYDSHNGIQQGRLFITELRM